MNQKKGSFDSSSKAKEQPQMSWEMLQIKIRQKNR